VQVLSKLFWADDLQTQIWIALILCVGAVGLVFLYLPLFRRVMGASRLSRRLSKLARTGSTSLPADFEATLGTSFLKDHWARFKKQWADSKTSRDENRAAVRWRDVFDDHPLLGTGSRRSMLAAIPGIFLALGILGTFVGLTLAIQGTDLSPAATSAPSLTVETPSEPMSAGEPAPPLGDPQVKQIADLVDYMGLAFRTSLWGMVLSMLSALSIRWLEGRAEWLEETLSDLAESVYPSVSPGELAARNLRGQREAFDLLRDELTTLGTNLGGALERNLAEIRASASGAAHEATQQQREQMQRLVEEINEAMRAGVSAHLAELQSAIADTGSQQRELVRHLAASFEQFRGLIVSHEQLAGRLDAASGGVESASLQLSRTAADFAPAVDHLHAAGRSLETTAATIERTQQTAADAVNAVSQALVAAKENLEAQGALVERSLGEIRNSIEGLSRGLADDLVRALGHFDQLLGAAVGRMSGTIHESNETFERLSAPLDQLLQGSTQLHIDLGEIAATIAQLPAGLAPLAETTGELTVANRDVREMLERLHKQIEATDGSVLQLRSTLGERSESLEQVARDLLDRMQRSASRPEQRAPARFDSSDTRPAHPIPPTPARIMPTPAPEEPPATGSASAPAVSGTSAAPQGQTEGKRTGAFGRFFGRG
jgi:chromosome segregation ATPase